jgi:uncharacterized protein YlxW (UPF0749 family)
MTNIAKSDEGVAMDRQEIERSIARLQTINKLRSIGLPIAAVSAGVAAVISAPIAFPVVAGLAAAATIVGEVASRRERARLDAQLRDLEDHRAFNAEEVEKYSNTANNFTVGGSSI